MMAEIRATLPATLNIKRLAHGQLIEL
jgi:hypothetical protein